jgi:hypothetical protein
MAITHGSATRDAVCNAVVDRLDLGSGTSAGRLVFQTAGSVAVATLPLSNPAFGNASSGVATANSITSDTNAAGGTTTKFELRDRDGAAVILGAVGTSGSDINLSSVIIGAGDTVSVSSLTYTAMP